MINVELVCLISVKRIELVFQIHVSRIELLFLIGVNGIVLVCLMLMCFIAIYMYWDRQLKIDL